MLHFCHVLGYGQENLLSFPWLGSRKNILTSWLWSGAISFIFSGLIWKIIQISSVVAERICFHFLGWDQEKLAVAERIFFPILSWGRVTSSSYSYFMLPREILFNLMLRIHLVVAERNSSNLHAQNYLSFAWFVAKRICFLVHGFYHGPEKLLSFTQ